MNNKANLIILYLILLVPSLVLADATTRFELKHRPAEEIIPIIKPLLKATDGISAHGFQLFIRTDDVTLAQITPLITGLDLAPADLLITIKNTNTETGSEITYAKGKAINKDHKTRSNHLPQIRTLEGRPVFIAQGQSIPYKIINHNQRLITGYSATEYLSHQNGFYLTAQLADNDVILTIESKQQNLSDKQRIQTQMLSTQIRGRLDEWLPLGKIEQTEAHTDNNVTNLKQIRTQTRDQIFVKVERINPD